MKDFSGILEIDERSHNGFVRERSHGLFPKPEDVRIAPHIITQYKLRTGAVVEGTAIEAKNRGGEAKVVARINGLTLEEWKTVKDFSLHNVISPNEWIRLENPQGNRSMRVVDLFCPIGKGQRALIVSPPKAGKTMLLQQLAHAVSSNYPEIVVLVLLVDERPEEVTDMQRTINGEVFASSSDSERGSQVRLAQLVLEYAKRKVETGKNVVLLLDSLTRLGRAFNIHQKSSGRTMSGGVDIRALEIPKRIFGAARKCEGSGSLTIIATALIETNSRMDELIFQEFKGTGNMELVLSRDLANERIFPAIDLNASGTRREELLFGSMTTAYQNLRRSLSRKSPREAMLAVLKLLEQYPTNEKLLQKFSS